MLHSLIYAGHTLITAFCKLKCLSSLNIRNYYYYYYYYYYKTIYCLKQLILQYDVLIISFVDEINLGLTLIYWTIDYDFTTLVLQLLLLLLQFENFLFFVFFLSCRLANYALP